MFSASGAKLRASVGKFTGGKPGAHLHCTFGLKNYKPAVIKHFKIFNLEIGD